MKFESEKSTEQKGGKPELSEAYVSDANLFVNKEQKLIERTLYEKMENDIREVQECVSLAHMAAQGFDFYLISPEKIQHVFDVIQETSDRMEDEVDSFQDDEEKDVLFVSRVRRLKEISEKLEYANGELVDAVRALARAEAEEERRGGENERKFRIFEKDMVPASSRGFNITQSQLEYLIGKSEGHSPK